jgi:hypothetical protein
MSSNPKVTIFARRRRRYLVTEDFTGVAGN